AQATLYGDHDATLRGPVELGQHDAGDVHRLGEHPGLFQAILTSGGVQDEQSLVHRPVLFHHPFDLPQLIHEADLVLEAAGGVDEHGVHTGPDTPFHRVEGHAGRVAAL